MLSVTYNGISRYQLARINTSHLVRDCSVSFILILINCFETLSTKYSISIQPTVEYQLITLGQNLF